MNLLRNRRLFIVLLTIWAFASFLIIRIPSVKSIDFLFQSNLSSCYKLEDKPSIDICVANASKEYWELLKISNGEFIDMLATFLLPIIFVFFLISIVKWIKNYDQK
jgi:hypothetical protein